ncbi:MAG: hypothetical protein MUP13_09520, partial [Thermoanaerobaculales bacterium]|nr:hypothetical protein [Thermoanaerobaculales bacterium]
PDSLDADTTTLTVAPTSTVTTTDLDVESTVVVRAFSYDPDGDGTEHDENIGKIVDGNPTTSWRTERYFDPLPQLKRGVGVVVELIGQPVQFEATGLSNGTAYTLMWAAALPATGVAGWERLTSGRVSGEQVAAQLPERADGFWLLWFTDLPAQEEGFYASLAEVRFSP